MITKVKSKIPMWYLFITESALVWFFLGTAMFIFESVADPELLKTFFGETTAMEILERPFGASIVYAVVVFCGLAGCLFILMHNRFAVLLLIFSFLATLIEQFYWWFILDIGNSLQGIDWFWPVIIPIIPFSLLLLSLKGLSVEWLH